MGTCLAEGKQEKSVAFTLWKRLRVVNHLRSFIEGLSVAYRMVVVSEFVNTYQVRLMNSCFDSLTRCFYN